MVMGGSGVKGLMAGIYRVWPVLSVLLELNAFKLFIHNICDVFLAVSVGGFKLGSWVALAWLTLPICVLKQVISVIQLIEACINTARLDESERERVNK